ncbi:protein PSK SIMULATOR 2-like [Carya illinoinensis]|uniref:protein PSK SIMULATOR 2-like n=1 Tax=Carya illinoinensis TaxID=32201 RepID=UPI001C71CC64|nr:protein PSK SIMULATOR 2-like [Carya illinoinensis]
MGAVCSGGVKKFNDEVPEIFSEKVDIKSSSEPKGGCDLASHADDAGKTRGKSVLTMASTPTSSTSPTTTPPWSKPKQPIWAGQSFKKRLRSGRKISILAFEVGITIAKGANLLQSLAEENIQVLRKEILHSGVEQLVSTDTKDLLSFATADTRLEYEVFLRGVIRFGDLCKDPQWHNLGPYFSKLDSDGPSHKQLKVDADKTVRELTMLSRHTSELYHEMYAYERFEQDYNRQLKEMESLNLSRQGNYLTAFGSELKEQRKLVKSLKKKSLWSRNFEEIVKKLLDFSTCIHKAIREAFGNNGITLVCMEHSKGSPRLGETGLAFHYANIISQINIIAIRPSAIPPNLRDQLYRALPTSVKMALRSRNLDPTERTERLSIIQVKHEVEKILTWLVPLATNTIKAQHFRWVGEWARTSTEFGKKSSTAINNPIRIQTLYYADKEKTDQYILKLVTLLHRVNSLTRHRDHAFKSLPLRSPNRKALDFTPRCSISYP